MDNRKMQSVVSGVLVVDKPTNMTSHDVVQIVRRGTGIRRAGHTGTLDPRASGVLVILVGPAVRISEYISAHDKRYQATLKMGQSTDTYDAEGIFTQESSAFDDITLDKFNEILQQFTGEIEQVPPPFSAVKIKGRKAYEMARRGEEVELKPRIINVYNLEVIEWSPPEVVIDIHCSSGTYVRSLAHDLGKEIGTGAYLIGLRRTKSGQFTLRDAVPLNELKESYRAGDWSKYLIPAAEALSDWNLLELDAQQVELVRHGHRIPAKADAEGWVRALSEQGDLVALMEISEDRSEWQPRKVFFQN